MGRLYFTMLIFISFFFIPFLKAQQTDITILVKFNEWMDTTGFSNPDNFMWTGGLITHKAELIDTAAALVTISEPEVNTWYTLKVCNVYDLAGNLICEGRDTTGFIIKSLPVELNSFSAEIINEAVHLEWLTETEVNNYGFEIERKIDNSNWQVISFVEGQGNSNSPHTYKYIDARPLGGTKFKYRLKQIDTDGKFEYSYETEVNIIPVDFSLSQNFPNPFNPVTTIKYSIPVVDDVLLTVYDLSGEQIEELVNARQQPGNYEVQFNALNRASGVYLYRIRTKNFVETKKMILLK